MLRLRPLRLADEAAFHRAYEVMAAEGFTFGFDYEPSADWSTYLKSMDDHRRAVNVPEGWVPETFLVADVAGAIVGRTSVRHELNERLEREGGHIGYCVLPQYRRRGYATEILHQSLIIARAIGIERVLVTCDDRNTGSITVIERCGGRLDSVIRTALPGTVKPDFYHASAHPLGCWMSARASRRSGGAGRRRYWCAVRRGSGKLASQFRSNAGERDLWRPR